VCDTIKVDLKTGEIVDHIQFRVGNVCLIDGGNNIGRVGTISHRERHEGGFDIVHLRDKSGKTFLTRISNVFVIGKGEKPAITICKDDGLYFTPLEAKKKRGSKVE